MFENPLTWVAIMLGCVLITLAIKEGKVEIEQEKTKQIEIQLKIEMIKAGTTNLPSIAK